MLPGCFIPSKEGPFASIIDARSGGVYLQAGEKSETGVRYTSGPRLCSVEEAKAVLASCGTIVSPNIQRLKERLNVDVEWEEVYPNLEQLYSMGFQKLEQDPLPHFEIMYLRKTQAELEKESSLS